MEPFEVDGIVYRPQDIPVGFRSQLTMIDIKGDNCKDEDGSHRECLTASISDAARWSPHPALDKMPSNAYERILAGLI